MYNPEHDSGPDQIFIAGAIFLTASLKKTDFAGLSPVLQQSRNKSKIADLNVNDKAFKATITS
jgi:hypothetical protein